MKNTPFDTRSSEWMGDYQLWQMATRPDNSDRLNRLRKNLRLAREQELTPRQRQMLTLYFDENKTMPQIAAELGVNCSTVSRTIRRARQRLHRCLQYGL